MSRESLPTWNVTSSMWRRTACFASACRRCSIRLRSSRTVFVPNSSPALIEIGLSRANPASVVAMPIISMPP